MSVVLTSSSPGLLVTCQRKVGHKIMHYIFQEIRMGIYVALLFAHFLIESFLTSLSPCGYLWETCRRLHCGTLLRTRRCPCNLTTAMLQIWQDVVPRVCWRRHHMMDMSRSGADPRSSLPSSFLLL